MQRLQLKDYQIENLEKIYPLLDKFYDQKIKGFLYYKLPEDYEEVMRSMELFLTRSSFAARNRNHLFKVLDEVKVFQTLARLGIPNFDDIFVMALCEVVEDIDSLSSPDRVVDLFELLVEYINEKVSRNPSILLPLAEASIKNFFDRGLSKFIESLTSPKLPKYDRQGVYGHASSIDFEPSYLDLVYRLLFINSLKDLRENIRIDRLAKIFNDDHMFIINSTGEEVEDKLLAKIKRKSNYFFI